MGLQDETPKEATERSRALAATVAVIIPVIDEAEVIGQVLAEIPPGLAHQVIVVDGGSRDGTPDVARAAGATVVGQPRPGYGAACQAGARAATADILVWLDGDYSDPPGELPRILAPLLAGRADLVLGCRRCAAGALPVHARLGNQLVTGLLALLYRRRVSDLPSFKALRRGTLAQLKLREQTYGWTTELIVKAIRQRLRLVEVPVAYRARAGGRSKVSGNWRASARAAYRLLWAAVRYRLEES